MSYCLYNFYMCCSIPLSVYLLFRAAFRCKSCCLESRDQYCGSAEGRALVYVCKCVPFEPKTGSASACKHAARPFWRSFRTVAKTKVNARPHSLQSKQLQVRNLCEGLTHEVHPFRVKQIRQEIQKFGVLAETNCTFDPRNIFNIPQKLVNGRAG